MTVDERGMTLIESLVVSLIISLMASAAGIYGLSWLRAERLRSATYEVFVQMSVARVEAVNRNRPCRFTVDTDNRSIRVFDLNDTAIGSDDEEIGVLTLDSRVRFGRPDGSPAVTLDSLTPSEFGATFAQDGSLTSSVGTVGLQSGDEYRRVSVYAGGAIAVERWDGSSWSSGS